MYQLLSFSKAKFFCVVIDLCFLLVHVLMLVIFASNQVTPMFYFNFFSITFYTIFPVIIHLGYLRFFVASTFIEVVLHMSLAIICTGWGNGYQITLIGMCALAFFAEYMGRTIRGKYVPAAPLSILAMAAYLCTYLYVEYNGAPYQLTSGASFMLQIIWGVIVFVILILCLQLFTLMSFHSARLLSIAATKDKLTELPNRYHIAKYEKDYLSKDRWIALADIDDFKKINDTYGHNFGDYVLKTLAEMMQRELKDCEICRWGGEEFLIVGRGSDKDRVSVLLDSFRRTVEAHVFSEDAITTKLTVTIGFAAYQPDITMTDWINIADKKLYAGKFSGKNQVVA